MIMRMHTLSSGLCGEDRFSHDRFHVAASRVSYASGGLYVSCKTNKTTDIVHRERYLN